MKILTSTLILLVAATGCAKMKEKMGQMKDNVQQSSSSAQSKFNSETQKRMNPDGSPAQDPGPPAGTAGNSAAQGAAAGGAAATTTTQATDSPATGSADGTIESTVDSGAADGSVGLAAGGYVPDCTKPNNAPEQVDTTGTERWQWTDAKKGAFMRFRLSNNMEMTYDVKDATDKLVLLETRTSMGGQLLNCSLDWQPRLFKKVEVSETEKIDYETKTTDLPDETVDVGGKSIPCKVRRVWTKVQGVESTSVTWTSSEVPGELVKTATESATGLETIYQLIEWRS